MASDLTDVTAVELNSFNTISVYPIPARDEIVVKGMKDIKSFSIVNILGSIVRTVDVTKDEMRVNISDLSEGIYIILTPDSSIKFVKK